MDKSNTYVLIIDRDRDRILTALFQSTVEEDGGTMFMAYLYKHKYLKQFTDLLEEVIHKQHALKFCDDLNCKYEK